MRTNIDQAGRVPGPRLVRAGKRLVARPSVPPGDLPTVDLAALVEEERHGVRVVTSAAFAGELKRKS